MTLNLTFLLVRISQNITRTTEPIPTNGWAMFSKLRSSAWAASNSLQSRDIIFEVNFLPFCRHRCSSILGTLYCFLANNAVDLSQNFSKCILYIGGLKSWGFHEVKWFFLSIWLSIFCCNCYQVPKVWFVSNKHHHNVRICVVSQFFQPSVNILKCCMASHIVHQKRTHCAAVVSTGDCTIPAKTNTVNQQDAMQVCGKLIHVINQKNGFLSNHVESRSLRWWWGKRTETKRTHLWHWFWTWIRLQDHIQYLKVG